MQNSERAFRRPDAMGFALLLEKKDWNGIRQWHRDNTPWCDDQTVSAYIEGYINELTEIDRKNNKITEEPVLEKQSDFLF